MDQLAARKWNENYRKSPGGVVSAAQVLRLNHHLLSGGKALDAACGLGGNAIELARAGYDVHAWDISEEALQRLHSEALAQGLSITTQQCDLIASPPERGSFDLIIVSRFLDRALLPALVAALRPDGLLFYQTFIADKLSPTGPSNPDYLLRPNELLHLLGDLEIRFYREDARCGDLQAGARNEAMFVGQKI